MQGGVHENRLIEHMQYDLQSPKIIVVSVFASIFTAQGLAQMAAVIVVRIVGLQIASIWFKVLSHGLFELCFSSHFHTAVFNHVSVHLILCALTPLRFPAALMWEYLDREASTLPVTHFFTRP